LKVDVIADVRFAARSLRKSPSFTAIALITLALGIGANAVVFSILDAVLLRPLPVEAPDRLFFVEAQYGNRNQFPSHSFPDYLDFKNGTSAIDLAGYRIAAMGLQSGAGAERAWGYLVTGNYFEMLGLRPAAGRFFTPEEDTARGASPYVVLSFDAWQRRFGGTTDIAGTTIRINGLPYTILGVAPRGFHGTEVAFRPELWVPMSMQPQIEGRSWLDERATLNVWIAGRLAPGLSVEQATTALNSIAQSIGQAHPRSHQGLRVGLARPGFVGSTGRTPVAAFMTAVMALAGLVLLAACANLANLMASRAIDRFREIAIRLAIGATRLRVARQMIIEAMLLSIGGGVAGFALAAALLRALARWQLPLPIPVQFEVTPHLPAFLFAAVVTVLVALGASIAPVRRAWRTQPARLTGVGAPDRIGRRWSSRDVLLAGQVILCSVLVTTSAVALENLRTALAMPLGFDRVAVSTAGFDLALAGYSPTEGRQFQQRALERMSALPGVRAAAYANSLPLSIDQSTTTAYPEFGDIRPSEAVSAHVYQVSPRYFEVLGTRLVSGRDFTAADTRDRPAVAIVNQAFVRRVLRSGDPLGRFRTGPTRLVQIVGVVEDGKYEDLSDAPEPAIFEPAAQSYNSTTVLVARSNLPEADIARQMAAIVTELDARVPLLSQGSLTDAIAIAFLPAQIAGVALTAFGVLAVVLALVGIYGLTAYSVSARFREIGIRMAIGAGRRHVLRFALGRTALLLGVGSSVGLLASVAAGQIMGAILYHASAREPAILAVAVLSMTAVGLVASWIPARRALGVDPARTLRDA
jgi:predicted permease